MADQLAQVNQALLGRYAIERELGRGGMATVYLALDLKHDRLVALKVLHDELATALGPERFLREIRLTARLRHAHILPVLDSGEADGGLVYYTMPYVEGESLRQRLQRERQLPVEEAVRIARQVLGALGHAHQQGIIHRDIKPENLLLSNADVMVADFGIAKSVAVAAGERLTETGLSLGTPHYMSPEQAAGESGLDGRADLYSTGCVLYEMLAGEPPFGGASAQAIMARHAVDPVPSLRTVRSTVPPPMQQAITKALAKVPADRFATAAEFAEALAMPASAPISISGSETRARWSWAALAAVLVLVVGGGTSLAFLHRGPSVLPSASLIAVLPLTPSVPDSGLARLGRDLVLTLSANLDGVGGIRIVDPHTLLAQTHDPGATSQLDPALALGRRFHAASVLRGSIVRLGSNVRLDLGLFRTDSSVESPAPLARVSVTNSADSVEALTDSVTRALLRQVWLRGEAPTPSLEAALKTSSVPALRAFLDGERAMLQSHWAAAAKAYQRTIEADSTFWLAYARAGYAARWAGQEPDSTLQAVSGRHLSELPERDRLILESGKLGWGDSVTAGLALAQRITDRFPDNWFGWMNRADMLVHLGPYVGLTRREAIDALERTVDLAPDFVPGWEHLVWMYLQEHDTAGSARALEALTRLDAGKALGEGCFTCDYLQQIRLLRASDRPGTAVYRALVDSVTQDVTHHWWAMQLLPLWYGSQQALIDVNRRAQRARTTPDVDWILGLQITRAWAARGAWDSAAAAMDHYVFNTADTTALRNYPLAIAGVLVGALNPQVAVRWGQAAHRAEGLSAESRAEIAWLDGVLAAASGSRTGLASARAALRQAGPGAKLLEESLAAFDLGLNGDTRRAGQALAALEWKLGERGFSTSPTGSLMAFDRLTASRWLLQAGDTAQAARLLTWHEAYDVSSMAAVLAPLVYLERARIEDARGQVELARAHYEQFLRRYDMPTAMHRHLVEEARGALARLGGKPLLPGQD